MSWGITAIGKAPAVLKEVERQSAAQRCDGAEEDVRQAACHAIKAALDAQGPNTLVKLTAAGSQNVYGGEFRNSLSIQIEPQYGFVE